MRARLAECPQLVDHVTVDSAGTAAYHIGEAPDRRSQVVASRYGYDLSKLRARAVSASDFDRFDYILAMDEQNLEALKHLAPADFTGHLSLLLDFAGLQGESVPDPYYGDGDEGFINVLMLIRRAVDGLVEQLAQDIK